MSRAVDEEDPSLLLIVLDASTIFWTKREAVRRRQEERPDSGEAKLLTFQDTVEAVLLLVQSYLMMHRRNDVCFVACSSSQRCGGYRLQSNIVERVANALRLSCIWAPGGLECFVSHDVPRTIKTAVFGSIVFPTLAMEREQRSLGAGSVSAKEFQDCLWEGLQRIAGEGRASAEADGVDEGCALAGGLSKGLCYVNRKLQDAPPTQARALVFSGAADVPETYNSVMNAIFSAQKAGVLVDCAVLGEPSTFLQQAAYLTGGLYLHHQEVGIAQYLLATFLPSQSCRKYLKLRKQQTVDFRAACFCHKKVVDTAYVCSVCLSVFCEFSPVCSTCGTKAWPKKVAAAGKRLSSVNDTSNGHR